MRYGGLPSPLADNDDAPDLRPRLRSVELDHGWTPIATAGLRLAVACMEGFALYAALLHPQTALHSQTAYPPKAPRARAGAELFVFDLRKRRGRS